MWRRAQKGSAPAATTARRQCKWLRVRAFDRYVVFLLRRNKKSCWKFDFPGNSPLAFVRSNRKLRSVKSSWRPALIVERYLIWGKWCTPPEVHPLAMTILKAMLPLLIRMPSTLHRVAYIGWDQLSLLVPQDRRSSLSPGATGHQLAGGSRAVLRGSFLRFWSVSVARLPGSMVTR